MERELMLKLDEFAWEAIRAECSKQEISAEDLIEFAVLYYLADCDSGRVARRIVPVELRQELNI